MRSPAIIAVVAALNLSLSMTAVFAGDPNADTLTALPSPAVSLAALTREELSGIDLVDPVTFERGREVFNREALCATCHGADGRGVVGSHPPLTGTPRVLGSDRTLSRIVLHGLRDKIKVRGSIYRTAMAPLGKVLSDREIADVLTYVRNAWGNRAPSVSEATVAEVRSANRRRTTSWTHALLVSAEIDEQIALARKSDSGVDGEERGVDASVSSEDSPASSAGMGSILIWMGAGFVGLVLLYMIGAAVTMKSDGKKRVDE